ncbi:MAG: ATP-dependent helicase [Firmicutes bacterium]|nr:ATP-dependent helicase [Bacillota bacterium]
MKLNQQQKDAVLHKDGPAVVLAVPGAGKTTVLICRTANLIMNYNVNPENILSLTFSRASAKDMKKRFDEVFGYALNSNIHFSTIHSFAYTVLREYSYKNKIGFKLLESKKNNINKNVLLKKIYRKVNNSNINDDKLEELLNTIGYVKNMMIDKNDFHKHDNFNIKNFNNIFTEYETFKKENYFIDFDDMLTFTYEILKNNSQLLNKYRNKYKYIQVDEGQDTSKVQNKILELLTRPNNNIFIVADDDQSIYGFRGAFPEALLNFKKRFPKVKHFFMEQNYRSSKNIVSVCNDFIKTNKTRYNKNLKTDNPTNSPVNIIKLKDEFSQLDFIVDELNKTKNLSDTAILYRNNISCIGLVEAFNKNNIPFSMRDSKLHFFKHWIVKDIVAFLNVALNDMDINSFERIYFKTNGYISKVAMKYIKTKYTNEGVFDRLLLFPNFKSFQIDNIERLRLDFKALSKKNPYQGLNFILKDLEYNKYLKDNCKKFGHSYENAKTILSHLNIIAMNSDTLVGFLEKLTTLQNILKKAKFNKEGVKLSTIHSSKGLEFEKVFMIDLIDGDFPSSSSIELDKVGDTKPLEEERRLFYVGMTRAKETLNLLTIKLRNEEKVPQSSFLDELEMILDDTVIHNFKVGDIVDHAKFGMGRIKKIKDDTATIRFDSNGIKKISLKISIENNILKAV